MTTAAEIRKSYKTEEVKINPTADLTEKEGSFLLGRLLNRRDVPFAGQSFKVYELEVVEGAFTAYEGKEKKPVKWSKGSRVQLKGTAMINWAMSNIADGQGVLIEYHGLKKSTKKGQNDAHDFTIERVELPA